MVEKSARAHPRVNPANGVNTKLLMHQQGIAARFQDNTSLISWVNQHRLKQPMFCLGDGHDRIWNLFAEIGTDEQRCEILDWYHLMENLGKVGGSPQRLDRVEARLAMTMHQSLLRSSRHRNTSQDLDIF